MAASIFCLKPSDWLIRTSPLFMYISMNEIQTYDLHKHESVVELRPGSADNADNSRGSKHDQSFDSEGEGDTTLTEAELRPESTTPKKSANSR